MDVGPAYTAESNLHFDVIVPTNGFVNVPDTDIAFTCGVFH
jgi:hypothetical protein